MPRTARRPVSKILLSCYLVTLYLRVRLKDPLSSRSTYDQVAMGRNSRPTGKFLSAKSIFSANSDAFLIYGRVIKPSLNQTRE